MNERQILRDFRTGNLRAAREVMPNSVDRVFVSDGYAGITLYADHQLFDSRRTFPDGWVYVRRSPVVNGVFSGEEGAKRRDEMVAGKVKMLAESTVPLEPTPFYARTTTEKNGWMRLFRNGDASVWVNRRYVLWIDETENLEGWTVRYSGRPNTAIVFERDDEQLFVIPIRVEGDDKRFRLDLLPSLGGAS